MGYPRDEGGYMLDTDASNVGIGAVLSQVQSKTLSKCESNYCIPDKEFLAVKYFMEHYRQYLLGRKFRGHTDHLTLKSVGSLEGLRSFLRLILKSNTDQVTSIIMLTLCQGTWTCLM